MTEFESFHDSVVHSCIRAAPGNRLFTKFRKIQLLHLNVAEKLAVQMRSKLLSRASKSSSGELMMIGWKFRSIMPIVRKLPLLVRRLVQANDYCSPIYRIQHRQKFPRIFSLDQECQMQARRHSHI